MLKVDVKALVKKLNPYCTNALEGAIGQCLQAEHSEVTLLDWLDKLIQHPESDFVLLLAGVGVDTSVFKQALQKELGQLPKGHAGKPAFSQSIFELLQDAWLIHSIHFGLGLLRSGALFLALVQHSRLAFPGSALSLLASVSFTETMKQFYALTEFSQEATPDGQRGRASLNDANFETPFLTRFGEDLTAAVRAGKVDPMMGREAEIRQMIDILCRRRKNNPILVGEAGVGKTALVEGLASKIVLGQVPDRFAKTRLISLDLGLLEAGASMKGEFEQRLKSVLKEVEQSPEPIILFVDEAHLLIGSGGKEGSNAANLLKPALARGTIRLIAATTWSEYKRHIEKDPALTRRFQLVKVGEPNLEQTLTILRGLRSIFEKSHEVMIRDDALQACASLATKYIPDRQQPDKAIDLLDTASARIRVNLKAKPQQLVMLEERYAAFLSEEEGLLKDLAHGLLQEGERLELLQRDKKALDLQLKKMNTQWQKELSLVNEILALRITLSEAADKNKKWAKMHTKRERLYKKLEVLRVDNPLVFYEVDPDIIAQIVSDWTHIPLGKLLRDEAATLLALEEEFHKKIKGQSEGVHLIAEQLKLAKAGLKDPRQPLGVFLLVGPSGVGKTETALTVADTLFGGEDSLITINMSEFQEKHTVSRLIGSPPGYVGFGEGGMLTEAVRKRPYSVVLLDEVEKAHPDVLNLFYQVFDKGVLTDSEGREVDFSNTILFLTSNLASGEISALMQANPTLPMAGLAKDIRPIVSAWFKPALLARMTLIPYLPLSQAVLLQIVALKMKALQNRIASQYRIELKFSKNLSAWLASECTEVEMGARNLDLLIRTRVSPILSQYLLEHMIDRDFVNELKLDLNQQQEICLS